MNKILVSVLTIALMGTLVAGQQYNAMKNKWETVPNDWDMKYNAMENDWSYQPKDAQIEYNAFENSWEWNSGHNE